MNANTNIVTYLDQSHGIFAQYCTKMAGFYPGFPRRKRREAEIAAKAAGVRQSTHIEWARDQVAMGAFPGQTVKEVFTNFLGKM